MSAKALKTTIISLIILWSIAFCFSSQTLAEGYDLTYHDPEGDVEDIEGITYREGYEHIDILEINSSENFLGTQLVLQMTVTGTITDSENITYGFELMDGEEMIYFVTYSNGISTGSGMDDENPDILQATGSGTSTLEVRVQMSNLGEISDFDFTGMTMDFNDEIEQILMDMVPDDPGWDDGDFTIFEMPVMITDPKPGATVSGTKTITGITDPLYEMVSVEIQFDSESENGWILTTTNDEWESFSHEWDTTSLSHGKHTLNARGYDGTEYYYDSISVYVDQSNAISPITTDIPELNLGYEYHYNMDLDMFDYDLIMEDMEMEMTAEMRMKVKEKESIDVNGDTYEAYVIDMSMSIEMTMSYEGESFSTSIEGEGTQWMRASDLVTIKTVMNMNTSYSVLGFSETSSEQTISTYDPPLDNYDFPMSIAETWTSISTVTSERTYSSDEGPQKESDSMDSMMSYEALHVEDVTVPAGTFETFVIWSMDASGEFYQEEGMSILGSGLGYSVEYYAPDIGMPVKTEQYAENRELSMSMELVWYGETGTEPGVSPGHQGWEIPVYYILIPIILAIILGSFVALRRRRRRVADSESWRQYTVYPEVPIQPNQPTSPHSQVYTSQPQAQVPPPQPPPPSPKAQTAAKPYYPPPPPTITNVQRNQIRQPSQPVVPSIQIKCPKCSGLFFVQKGSPRVQCPNCGTTGNIQW